MTSCQWGTGHRILLGRGLPATNHWQVELASGIELRRASNYIVSSIVLESLSPFTLLCVFTFHLQISAITPRSIL